MNRKMRAKLSNSSAKASREHSARPRHQVGRAVFLSPNSDPLFLAPVHIDHEEKSIEILPEKSEMN